MLLQACDGGRCEDADGDGFGAGCSAGNDCDDSDPTRELDCERPPSDCEANPEAIGCSCAAGSRVCYDAPLQTQDVGPCVAGTQRCVAGRWSGCRGAVLPAIDYCNDLDDDCDGRIDERVQSPCGGCDTECTGGVWGTETVPFSSGPGLALTPDGELTLAHEAREATVVWVASGGDRSVAKLDADRAAVTARYRLAGAEPTRVAVDYPGDAWVLSPDDGASVLTHIAASRDNCRMGDAAESSMGPDDLRALGEDDCVLLSARVGADSERAQALAIDGQLGPDGDVGGHPWVGLVKSGPVDAEGGRGGRIAELDPKSGAELRSVDLPDVTPHVAAFDRWGVLWVASQDGWLAQVDLTADPPGVDATELPLTCFSLEALVTGSDGSAYLSGFSCENVMRFNPRTGQLLALETDDLLTTRGLALADDALFVAHTSGSLSRLSLDPISFVTRFTLSTADASPQESIGLSSDSLGQLWVVSSHGEGSEGGVATRFDPTTAEVTAQVPVGALPRALGDFTGMQLAGAFEPEASARHVFEGCHGTDALGGGDGTRWLRVRAQSILGPGARLSLRIRHADTREGLPDAAFVELGLRPPDTAPWPLDLPEGGYLELELTLHADQRTGAPRVQTIGVEWQCPGPQ